MESIQAIMSRRSIRKFSEKPVEQHYAELLVRAGMQAPSAKNKQPWQFYIIRNREMLNYLCDVHPYGKMLAEASFAIVVCGDKKIEELESYLLQNCSAATQNILLAAHSYGLGSVWLGIHPREDRLTAIREMLKMPEHIFPISMIAIGYPGEDKIPEDRFIPERVNYID